MTCLRKLERKDVQKTRQSQHHRSPSQRRRLPPPPGPPGAPRPEGPRRGLPRPAACGAFSCVGPSFPRLRFKVIRYAVMDGHKGTSPPRSCSSVTKPNRPAAGEAASQAVPGQSHGPGGCSRGRTCGQGRLLPRPLCSACRRLCPPSVRGSVPTPSCGVRAPSIPI